MFDPLPGRTYLDAATYGLPPRPAVEAMERALRAWQTGSARWVDDWDRPAEAARAEFASIIGATAEDIALLPSASVAMGLVADALKAGDVVVVPEDEHVSDLFPLLVAERRGVEVRQVPFADVVGAIDDRTTLVASSLVQMQTGRIGDLDGICRRARAVGARVFIDATHALPFVPVAPHIADIDFLVCHAYKHMLGARGTAFLYVRSDRLDDLMPSYANWRGAPDPWTRFFGGPLTLADDASRFNVSLAWLPWAATVESTRLIARVEPRRDARRATRAGRSTGHVAGPGADRLIAGVRAHRRSRTGSGRTGGGRHPSRRPRRCDPVLAPCLERLGRCGPGGRGDPSLDVTTAAGGAAVLPAPRVPKP